MRDSCKKYSRVLDSTLPCVFRRLCTMYHRRSSGLSVTSRLSNRKAKKLSVYRERGKFSPLLRMLQEGIDGGAELFTTTETFCRGGASRRAKSGAPFNCWSTACGSGRVCHRSRERVLSLDPLVSTDKRPSPPVACLQKNNCTKKIHHLICIFFNVRNPIANKTR